MSYSDSTGQEFFNYDYVMKTKAVWRCRGCGTKNTSLKKTGNRCKKCKQIFNATEQTGDIYREK